MNDALENYTPGPTPALENIIADLGEVSVGAQSQLQGDMTVAGGSVSGTAPRRSRRSKRSTAK